MNITVQTLCSACNKCEAFEIELCTALLAKNEEYVVNCKHLDICRKAVEIWEKRNESQEMHS